MQRLNQDGTSAQVDHILPSVVALDYRRFGGSWLDFRSPGDDYTYHLLDAMLQADPTTGILSEYESPAWPSITGTFNGGSYWYGDLNAHSNGRDHAHFFDEYTTTTTYTAAVTTVQGPFTH